MAQYCTRCQRANPDSAVFCHFDGCLLRQGAGVAGVGPLLQEFVFPSGRRCRTFDELVQGCYYEWEEARQLLADGTFGSFLAGLGRADLAKVAREVVANGDRDIALTNFIGALPAASVQGPKLGLSPRKLVVGPVRVGEARTCSVKLANEGQGLLQGNAHISDGVEWLSIVEGDTPHAMAVKTARDVTIALRADTARLTIGQNYSGKLVLVTNGGVAEVPIRLDLVVRPFARAPYAGANSPRDLARRMSKEPDPAVGFLESGEVERWFASNGWTYPIAGPAAPGRAAVQQFFEELGLAKPPPIALSEQEFRFRCTPPEILGGQVTMKSNARRIVYGRVESDAPWLKVKTPNVAGSLQTAIDFEVDSSKMDEDRLYLGTLKIVANGGQSFGVRVQVDVQGNKKGWFGKKSGPAPVPAPPPPPPVLVPVSAPASVAPVPNWVPDPTTAPATVKMVPAGAARPSIPAPGPTLESVPVGGGLLRMVLVGAMLGGLGRLLLVFPADLFARLLGGPPGDVAAGSLAAWLQAPGADDGHLRLFVLATWWIGSLAGAVLVWRAGGRITDLFCGLLAGAVLGLAGSATLGCVVALGDSVPRTMLSAVLGGKSLGPAVATPLWIVTAVLSWVGIGAAAGLGLFVLGKFGAGVMTVLSSPLSGLCRVFGLGKAADFLALRG